MKKIVLLSMLGFSLLAQSSQQVAKKSFAVISGYESSISQTTMILRNREIFLKEH